MLRNNRLAGHRHSKRQYLGRVTTLTSVPDIRVNNEPHFGQICVGFDVRGTFWHGLPGYERGQAKLFIKYLPF